MSAATVCTRKWDIYFHFGAQITVVKCVVCFFFAYLLSWTVMLIQKQKLKKMNKQQPFSWHENMLRFLLHDIICYEEWTVFREQSLRKTVSLKKENYPSCNVRVLPRWLGVTGSKAFLPLWHACNGAPWVWIKIIVYLIHGELISGQISHKHIIFKVKQELLVIIILWNRRLSLNIPQFWTGIFSYIMHFNPSCESENIW